MGQTDFLHIAEATVFMGPSSYKQLIVLLNTIPFPVIKKHLHV